MIELRVITEGRYWTVYQGKKYLGAIAYHSRRSPYYSAVHDGQVIGYAETLDEVKGLFNHIGESR